MPGTHQPDDSGNESSPQAPDSESEPPTHQTPRGRRTVLERMVSKRMALEKWCHSMPRRSRFQIESGARSREKRTPRKKPPPTDVLRIALHKARSRNALQVAHHR